MEYFFLFVLGAAIGSFLNVCIARLPKNESLAFPPSHCMKCRHRLGYLDLIPIFSWLWLRGKCRYCGEKITFRYVVVELLTACAFVFAALWFPTAGEQVSFMIISAILIVIFFIDFQDYIIPDEMIWAGLAWGSVTAFFQGNLLGAFIALLIGGGFLWGVRIIAKWFYHKEALGFGDVKLGAMLGVLLGVQGVIMGLFLGYLFGAIYALLLIALRRKTIEDIIPFGPFLVIGAVAVLVNFGFWHGWLLPWW